MEVQIFQKLEQESEKRAQDEAELDDNDTEMDIRNEADCTLHCRLHTLDNALLAEGTTAEAPTTPEAGPSTLPPRDRRRASVSISVFGQVCSTTF